MLQESVLLLRVKDIAAMASPFRGLTSPLKSVQRGGHVCPGEAGTILSHFRDVSGPLRPETLRLVAKRNTGITLSGGYAQNLDTFALLKDMEG
jgi:hypothetical protein